MFVLNVNFDDWQFKMSKIMIIIMIIMPMHQLIENVQTNDLYIDYDL